MSQNREELVSEYNNAQAELAAVMKANQPKLKAAADAVASANKSLQDAKLAELTIRQQADSSKYQAERKGDLIAAQLRMLLPAHVEEAVQELNDEIERLQAMPFDEETSPTKVNKLRALLALRMEHGENLPLLPIDELQKQVDRIANAISADYFTEPAYSKRDRVMV